MCVCVCVCVCVLFDEIYFVLKQFFLSAMTSENCLKPKVKRQLLIMLEDEIFRILKKSQEIGCSSNLVSLMLTGQVSMPYKSAGTHLERINENKTSRDAQLPALPMIALNDL